MISFTPHQTEHNLKLHPETSISFSVMLQLQKNQEIETFHKEIKDLLGHIKYNKDAIIMSFFNPIVS